jgi:hypothetical protein
MKSGLRFLMAAKRCELAELEQLAHTSELVNVTARLVHGLQRERGLSNLYLAAPDLPDQAPLATQMAQCEQMAQQLRHCFDSLHAQAATPASSRIGQGARLFSRMAYVLHGLDALPHLRTRVLDRRWSAPQVTAAYIKLVAGLLAVVFEAADSASDPQVSRLLVAFFNFMQGKELAGQERATGAALLTAGKADTAAQQRLLHLIDSQERCFQVFNDFASPALRQLFSQAQDPQNMAELERLRRLTCTTTPHAGALDSGLGPIWFECCTRRMDELMAVENQLAQDLMALCQQKIEAAQQELQRWDQLQRSPAPPAGPSEADQGMDFFEDLPLPLPSDTHALLDTALPPVAGGHSSQVERSILELVREQSQRLQAMSAELDTVRASLTERKLIERAKGLLMAHRQLSEVDAHKLMRQTAMNQNRRVSDVAQTVLAMAEMLPPAR